MLVSIHRFTDTPILSLQTGAEIAKLGTPIIDPRQLKITAFRVTGNRLDHSESVLHPEDIREISNVGIIVDSSDKLMSIDGLVRLQEIIDFKFVLEGIRVEDDAGHKLGTVKEYAIDPESFFVKQLYVQPSIIRSLRVTALTINRSQIISINNRAIVVKSPTIKEEEPLAQKVTESLRNPFRSPNPQQPESKEL